VFNHADNGLSALVDVDVFDSDLLLALAAISSESLHLKGERPRKLIEGAFRAISLKSIIRVSQTASRCQRRHMNGGHLRCEHCLDLVPRSDAFNDSHAVIEHPFVYFAVPGAEICELIHQSGKEISIGSAEGLHEEGLTGLMRRVIRHYPRGA
jgi:hypothetical protein